MTSPPIENVATSPAVVSPVTTLRFVLAGFLFSAIWSSAFIAGKFGLQVAPPLWLLTLRFLAAGFIMLALARALGQGKAWQEWGARPWLSVAALGVLNNTAYLGLTFVALKTVPAGLTTLIVAIHPLVTALLAAVALSEPANGRRIAGLLLGFAGVALVVERRMTLGMTDGLAMALLVVGVAALALGTVLFRRLRMGADLLAVNAVQTLVGGLALLPFAAAFEEFSAIRFDARFWLAQAWLVCGVSIGAVLLWFWLLNRGQAAAASAFHFLNPVFGIVLAVALLGEPLVLTDLMGAIPIAIGIAWAARAR